MASITTKFTEQHFQLLYTHARCCSLLRQAATTALVELAPVSDPKSDSIKIIQPTPIPWLTTSQTLQFQHLAEQQLLWQLVSTFDNLECVALSRDATWKKAVNLAEHFQQFHRFCPIWGVVGRTQPNLAQARLGLVNLTQHGLRQMIHDKLNLPAPSGL
jgi:arginyl-tRNA synthetase